MIVLPWILFALAAIAVIIVWLGQNDAKKRLADAETKLRDTETALEAAKKQPVAAVAAAGKSSKGGKAAPVPAPAPASPVLDTNALADAEKRLASSLSEIKRLETAVAEAEKRVATEREKAEAAYTKAATAEALVTQARSRTAEAGHAALNEAKQETESVRAALADAEKRLVAVAANEKKFADLVAAAKTAEASAQSAAERAKALEADTASLRAKLAQAESAYADAQKSFADKEKAQLTAAEKQIAEVLKAQADAVQAAEKTQREQYAIQLHKARTEWETETKRLSVELNEAKQLASVQSADSLQAVADAEKRVAESISAAKAADSATQAALERASTLEAETKRLAAELEAAKRSTPVVAPAPVPVVVVEDTDLPVRRPRPTATKASEITGEGTEKPLVILADTDANIQKTLTKHLEDGGYAVRTVATFAEMMDSARTTNPAALAVDAANLPDGDCWKVLTSLKEDADLKEIPVIVFAPGKDKERALDMGAAGCFPKPIDKAVLVATIKAAMVKRKQRARLAAVTGGNGAARRSSLLTTPSV